MQWVDDLIGRWTFSANSHSPLYALFLFELVRDRAPFDASWAIYSTPFGVEQQHD